MLLVLCSGIPYTRPSVGPMVSCTYPYPFIAMFNVRIGRLSVRKAVFYRYMTWRCGPVSSSILILEGVLDSLENVYFAGQS